MFSKVGNGYFYTKFNRNEKVLGNLFYNIIILFIFFFLSVLLSTSVERASDTSGGCGDLWSKIAFLIKYKKKTETKFIVTVLLFASDKRVGVSCKRNFF